MKPYAALIPVLIVLFIGLFAVTSLTVIVNPGHVGVVNRLGAVQMEALKEGFHLKRPFMDSVEQLDIRLIPNHSKANAASRDLQTVSTEVNISYSINGAMAPQIYQRVGNVDKVSVALVTPAIQESVKAVTAKFTAEELVTKRDVVKQQIQEAIEAFINHTLREKDLNGAVNIANVAITDFSFSPEFDRAIESKVKAEQEALRAKNEKIMRITQAEASAQEIQLAASAEAFKIEAVSKARADAIRREAEALTSSPEIISLRAVEKWDGILPRISSSGSVPFLNLSAFDQPDATPTPAPKPTR